MARLYTFSDAERLSQAGKPWTFALVYGNTKMVLTGRARNEPAEIYVETTTPPPPPSTLIQVVIPPLSPTILVTTWDDIVKAMPSFVQRGFAPTLCDFVRVRQTTIDAWQASQASPTVAPPVIGVGTQVAPGVSVTSIVVTPSTDPYSRIVSVAPDTAAGNWKAFDAQGHLVMRLTKLGARQFVQDNPHVTIVGL